MITDPEKEIFILNKELKEAQIERDILKRQYPYFPKATAEILILKKEPDYRKILIKAISALVTQVWPHR